ncbi:VOC family protein [Vibrio ulleungensis]|uniref:VOC family protein n=1 Tax=Vibrio ulleungensis TaxID=2807619 RepID=A0ABS2HKD5_9VIBR|nr:VOC family protein [Vibrio ulleungensis]MBM7037955.1 VOC family protein [Vibrio ulleungensis]
MNTLTPYLFFNGKCAEALDFYCAVFEGKIGDKQLYSEAPQAFEGADPNWVMHATFECDLFTLMMSDGTRAQTDKGVAFSLEMNDRAKQKMIFDRLAEEGEVVMPLEDTFWGAHFGQVADKYGFRWMLHCSDS